MDYDGQRLLDVINDPNALESFLDGSAINSGNSGAGLVLESSATAITQQQLQQLQQKIHEQQQQLQQLQQLHSPFSVPVRSPAPSPAATVILRSPAAAAPHPASPSSSHASSPATSSLGHAFSVSSPAPAPSPGPQQQFYRAAPSPQHQRSGSLSSTPVASPINYPPGPGPGNGQVPAGTITIPALGTAVGQVQQIVSGGQVLQILSASSNPTPQVTNTSPAVVRNPVAAARPKQPQLRPKPANSAGSSPSPAQQQAPSVSSPRATPPVANQQQPIQQTSQQQQIQQQQQHQLQQQIQQQQHTSQVGQVVQLGSGGPTGTLVFSGGNSMFPALAPTGGQFFLQQQGGGGFQLIVRPPMPSASPPKQQQPQQQPTILMQPQLGPTVQLNHRPVVAAPPPAMPQQPMVRLVTLPGLGTVQLQQIQTPNGPAFLAVQQPQQQQIQQQLNTAPFLRAAAPQHTFIQQHHIIQQQPQQLQQTQQQMQSQPQETVRLVSSPATTTAVEVTNDNSSNSAQASFAAPPKKPAKKKPPKKKKKEELVEEKRPAVQVNLAELMKQTGIVDDDESFFMMDDEPVQPPAPADQHIPLVETKENNVVQQSVDAPTLSETSIIQTLQQHGLALSADDLYTLRNFIKPVEQSSALGGGDSLVNGLKPAAVSLTLGNGQVIQLTEPFENQQQQQQILQQQPPKVQFLTTQTPLFATNTSVQDQQGEVVQQQHGFQNSFLEDLARSQIVSDPKKNNKTKSPAPANKKKPEPKKKKPPVNKTGKDASATATIQASSTTTAGTVQRVQTIKLSPQNQQNLRNIQAQIQYLNSKKDPSPQDTSLLQKLIEHHSKILATGKPVPTIPGQHAQGVPFNASSANKVGEGDSVVEPNTGTGITATTGGASNRPNKVPVPANIQQNTHLANLLRQPVSDKSARVTTSSNAFPQQQAANRFAQPGGGAQSQKSPATSIATTTNVSVTTSTTSSTGSVMSTTTTTTTQSTIQSPMGTLLLTVVDAEASAVTQSGPVATSQQSTVEPSPTRGVKRQAALAPKASISKTTLFEHQLKTDQNGALAPDCKTPFKNKTNACKRLVRYHVFHELGPTPQELEKEEDELEERADQLITKFHTMINKYHHLLLTESTKEAPASEFVMVERMFVGEEKQSLERLKEEARVAKELQLTPVWPSIKTEHDPIPLVNGTRETAAPSSEEISLPNKISPKVAPIKFTRKEGEGYRSELQEYKDARVMVEDVVKSNGRIHGDEATSFGEAKPYDEWEAIQRELALYPETRDKDDMGFGIDDGSGEIIYDEDIKAQMQNAIDDLLRLNGCDEGPSGHSHSHPQQHAGAAGVATLSSPSAYDGGYNGEMQVDLALNEAVNSIL